MSKDEVISSYLEQSRAYSSEEIRFPFEEFLEENINILPRGVDVEYSELIIKLQKPHRNIGAVWKAIWGSPYKVIFHAPWNSYVLIASVFYLPFLLAIIGLTFITFLFNGPLTGVLQVSIAGTLGYASAVFYLKFLYMSYFRLVNQTKYPWLSENLSDEFNKYFNKRHLPRALRIAIFTSTITYGVLVLLLLGRLRLVNIYEVILILGIGALTILFLIPTQVVLLSALMLVPLNTTLYGKIVNPILHRIQTYQKGYESILSKNNYEVIMILGDSPALSTRELGEIPLFTLGLSTLTFNGLVFTILSPVINEVLSWSALQKLPINATNAINKTYQSTYDKAISAGKSVAVAKELAQAAAESAGSSVAAANLLLIILALAIIWTFSSTMWPIIKLTWFMYYYKNKALEELDSFLFDKIMAFASGAIKEIESETEVLFNLRQYVYNLKRSPVNPLRLLQMSVLFLLYIFRGLRGIGG